MKGYKGVALLAVVWLLGCAPPPTEVIYIPDANEFYYPGCCKTPKPCQTRCAPQSDCYRRNQCAGMVYGNVNSGTVVIRSSNQSVWQQLFIN